MTAPITSRLSIAKKVFSPSWRGLDVSSWGGLQPVYVTRLPKSFAWEKLDTADLPSTFVDLFRRSNINLDLLSFRKLGYRAWKCVNPNCEIDTIYLPMVKCGIYHPWNSFKHASRCVARIMPRIEFMEKRGADYLICLDLTTPHYDHFRKDPDGTIRKLRKAVNHFLQELHKELFPGKKSKLGGFYSLHTWKTTKPLDFHFHVHLQLFNVAFDGKAFHRFHPFLDLRKVREAWRKSLLKFGLWAEPSPILPDVHDHYIKLENRPRLVHRLRYIYRRPLEDLAKYLTPQDLEGLDVEWVRWLIRYTPRQVFVGFATSLKRLGFACPKSDSLICPVCGHPMRRGEFYPDLPPGTPICIQLNSGEWLVKPPPKPSEG